MSASDDMHRLVESEGWTLLAVDLQQQCGALFQRLRCCKPDELACLQGQLDALEGVIRRPHELRNQYREEEEKSVEPTA